MDYSGIAIPVGSRNHIIRYFGFNGSGTVRIINVEHTTNTVISVFNITTNAV